MYWSIDNVLTVLSIVLAIIGGTFAYIQWKSANKLKRSEFINQIIDKLRFDKDLVKTMYLIEYDYGWYSEKFHSTDKELEYEVDKLLSYLSYICYVNKLKIISNKEFSILQYELNRTCSSPAVQCYLWNLYHFSKSQNTKCTFHYLIEYGTTNKIINKEFYNKMSTHYSKYLNF